MNRLLPLLPLSALLFVASPSFGDDWPQWRGPNRDGISKETGLKKDWSKDEPKLLWTYRDAGRGYGGPSVVGNNLYLTGCRKDEKDFLVCLDTATGKEVWATPYADFYDNGWGGGPRGNVTAADNLLYLVAPKGEIVCFAAKDGKLVWRKDFVKDLGGKLMSGWGFSESPLVDGDKVICTPGGGQGTLAALDKKTGEVVWRSKDLKDDAGYASVVVSEFGGTRQYVTTTAKGVVGVAAKDGKLLWKHENPRYNTAVIPTPIVSGEYVFATTGYGAGCDLLKLTGGGEEIKAEQVYKNKSTNMVNHHGGVILYKDHVYGFNDGNRGWTCLNLKSGEIVWEDTSKNTPGKGAIAYADERFYLLGEKVGDRPKKGKDGKKEESAEEKKEKFEPFIAQIVATTEGYQELGRLKLPEQTTLPRRSGQLWAHPVIANGKLYLRDQDLLFCFDVKAAQ
jgi:outer membrane protein assembly factor BamB